MLRSNNLGLVDIDWPRRMLDVRLVRAYQTSVAAGSRGTSQVDAGETLASVRLSLDDLN